MISVTEDEEVPAIDIDNTQTEHVPLGDDVDAFSLDAVSDMIAGLLVSSPHLVPPHYLTHINSRNGFASSDGFTRLTSIGRR